MRSLRARFGPATIVVALATAALLQARGVSALVSAELVPPAAALAGGATRFASVEPARAAKPASADALLARNPFDHETGSLLPRETAGEANDGVAGAAPPCPAVHALFTVRGEAEEGSLAALDVDGKRLVRARGGEAGDRRVLAVGFDRVWLGRGPDGADDVCVAPVFGGRPEAKPVLATPMRASAPLDPRLQKGVVRVSKTETHVDASALEALSDAMSTGKLRAVPERDGDRLLGLRLGRVDPTSPLALLGFESSDRVEAVAGIELNETSALLEGWARLRATGQGRVPVRVNRGGHVVQLDFVVR